jgi:hypothetical protein
VPLHPPQHQADGTLPELLADELVLRRLLAPLGGGGGVRAAATQASDAAAAEGAGGSGNTHSSPASPAAAAAPRDPEDSIREALAEAVAALVRLLPV